MQCLVQLNKNLQEVITMANKPPLGIMPFWVWIAMRKNELSEAIIRYTKYDYPIPIEWVEEYNKHIEALRGRAEGDNNDGI